MRHAFAIVAVVLTGCTGGAAPPAVGPPPSAGVDCRAAVGNTRVAAHFAYDAMKGTVAIDGAETRRFDVRAVPHAATYALMFLGYGAGDTKTAGETLDAEKSMVLRLVSVGDETDLYLDGDVRPAGTSASTPLRCVREQR